MRVPKSYIRDTKDWEEIQYRASHALQSAELNEQQKMAADALKGIGDSILSDGNRVAGADINVNKDTGYTTLTAGKIYIRGRVREVGAASFTIPVVGTVMVGVFLRERLETELQNPALRDPAPDTRNYGEPGAARLLAHLEWGFGGGDGFYGVYTVVDGVVRDNRPAPEFDGIYEVVARYDRESNGSYVVYGLALTYLGEESVLIDSVPVLHQVFSLAAGKAHVNGYEVELPYALRLKYPLNRDLQLVESEPSLFTPAANGQMRINTHQAPIVRVVDLEITEEKTVSLTHGAYSGVRDPLPDTAVLEIRSVKQGATTYQAGIDYTLTGALVDWTLSGAEPAPGSTYTVTYRHQRKVQPSGVDTTGFSVAGAVPGTLVLVDYEWALPRIDILTLDKHGLVRKLNGIPHAYRAPVPTPPTIQIKLATIYQNWMAGPTVKNDSVQVVAMDDLRNMREWIYDLYDLVAIERLKTDAIAKEPTSKRGIFVDPFLDDDLRDQGLEQTAAVINGELQLAIDVDVFDLTGTPKLLDYTLDAVLEQLAQTGMMLVNPYQAFEPIPAEVTLIPPVDFWTEEASNWTSPETVTISSGTGGNSATLTDTRTEITRVQTLEAQTLRVREVEIRISGFAPGERLTETRFDNIPVEVVSL